jgi:1-acyl-sn-glycerol-3-phosphate acyltransferase
MILLRSLLFYAGAIAGLLVFTVIAPLVYPLPYPQRYWIVTRWTHLTLWWLEVTCNLRCRVSGLENIPKEPAIILCKHQSAWETMALQKFFPAQVWVLKRSILWLPLFGWCMATLEPIAIDRGSAPAALKQLVREGKKRLETRHWITLFPEGTRVAPGEKRKYALGGGLLAAQAGCPVVPVAHNAGLFWPRNSILKRPGVIDVEIGPIIDSKGKTAAEIMGLAEEWIEATSDRLLSEAGVVAETVSRQGA